MINDEWSGDAGIIKSKRREENVGTRVKRATQIHREPVAYLFTPRPSYARTCDVVNACTEVFRNRYLALFSSYRCGAHWYRDAGYRERLGRPARTCNFERRRLLFRRLSPISTSGIDGFAPRSLEISLCRSCPSITDRV